ncbi:MAG: hypothetical protein AABX19_04215 [Nanoarchaeota archaeon]
MESNKCEECNKKFETKEAQEMHNKSKHNLESNKKTKSKNSKFILYTIMILAIILLVSVVTITKQQDDDNNIEIDIPENPIHWHPHLTIKIDGENINIPENIGITPSIHYPVHTHETDGTIHLENNNPTTETLRVEYFFKVWDKKFNKECILDYCTDKGTIKMTVNGKENTEYENYMWKDKDEILIEYTTNK